MANQGKSNIFHHFQMWSQRISDDGGQIESQNGQKTSNGFTTESSILDKERAGRAALTLHAEGLCAVEKALKDAVLERLGLSVQDIPLPSPQPPTTLPLRSTKSPWQRRRLAPLVGVTRLHVEDITKCQRSPTSLDDEEDDSFWDKVFLGGQMAACAIKEAQMAEREASPTASLRSVDTCTPTELRAIPLIEDIPIRPTPPPTPRALPPLRRRTSRLPVLTGKFIGSPAAPKRSPAPAPEMGPAHAPKRTVAVAPERTPTQPCRRTQAETPLSPTPPPVPPTQKRGTRPGLNLRSIKVVSGAGKRTAQDCSPQTKNDRKVKRVELQPLTNPMDGLSSCFKLLSSDDWEREIDGLKIIQALAQHHSEILKTKLHEVCLVLIEQVKNLRSAVACAAMNTVAELYIHLKKAMDPEVEGTGRALLLKLAASTNAFIQQQANLALDAMVGNCSHGRILSVLLNTGLNHRCVAVRGSMAQHMHQLADNLGARRILTAGRTFTERFLLALSKMCVDGAPEVRHHGQTVLLQLAQNEDFLNMWTKIVPEKERRSLNKIFKKVK
ncbi:crescerin-like protein che-12 [Plectropomus leopardus]|uniref:crescerin-like protein che-12 n=1 Tax=Plectropomus leopardus TaxID=160734 RepID=UPI001C4B2F6B|nr:crescerin-like protein che-12 [Plectropomus leopardus]